MGLIDKQKKIFNDIYLNNNEEADSYTNIRFIENELKISEPLLEIGTGKGYVLNYLTMKGFDILGLEICEEAVKIIKTLNKNCKVQIYDGVELPFENNSFATIFSFDVIEHIKNISFHFKEVYRILKDNGIYAFQTPNIITNLPKEIIFRRGLKNALDFHPSVQSYFGLRRILKKNGFKYKFVSMPLISEEKYLLLFKRSPAWKIIAKTLKVLPSCLIPIFLRPNFWVISTKQTS